MKSVLLCLWLCLPLTLIAQKSVTPLDSSRTTFTIFLRDGGQYVGRIVERDSIKVVVHRQGGGLSYLAPSDITRIEPYQSNVRLQGRERVNITMVDGTIYTGEIRQRDSTRVILRRRGGESILSPKEIARIDPVGDGTNSTQMGDAPSTIGVSRVEDNQFPWLLYNQTAIPLRRGQLAYRNIWFLYNEVSYGLLSFLSLRASITPSFYGQRFFEDAIYTRPALGAKLSIPLGSIRIGGDLSVQWYDSRQFNFSGSRKIYFRDHALTGFVTFGSVRRNLTLAYTNLRSNRQLANRNSIDIGFVAPIGRRLSLLSDNRILLDKNSYEYERFSQVSGVLRLNRPRHAFDLGALIAIRDEEVIRLYPMPYLAFNMRVSKK